MELRNSPSKAAPCEVWLSRVTGLFFYRDNAVRTTNNILFITHFIWVEEEMWGFLFILFHVYLTKKKQTQTFFQCSGQERQQ